MNRPATLMKRLPKPLSVGEVVKRLRARATFAVLVLALSSGGAGGAVTVIPDGRSIDPAGFTVPVEGFASAEALSNG
jgi:hypothetical protein